MHVFTYGTLMFPPVWHEVTGSLAFGKAATLVGFERRALRGRTYPGLVEAPDGSTEGILYVDVSETALRRLDAFEGDEYERATVTVQTHGGPRTATTYVLAPRRREDLEHFDWEPPRFARHVRDFVRTRRP
jgi:gamma-glutamylcyclotransferase (GGCT)/AIG2-like uncharacterized protein YtfP